MPSCSGRNILYALLALQLISTLERQIFDFLGYMWMPILANFMHTLVVILGIFGVYQYTSRHMLTYLVWCLIWIAWNTFLICYYLDVGDLNKHEDVLSFGTGSYSWWLIKGIGCNPNWNASDETFQGKLPSVFKPERPSSVSDCLLDHEYVEVIHASIQVVLAILALLFGIPLAHYLIKVVEPKYRHTKSGQKFPKQAIGNGHAMYSIEYNQVNEANHAGANAGQETDFYSLESGAGNNGEPRPHMTPRRVKRRSYTRSSARSAGKALKKDTHNRQSGRSVRSASGAIGATNNRANKSINPVNRLMQETEPRPLINDSSTSNDDGKNIERYGQVNPGYVSSRPNSLYSHANNVPQSITDYEASRPPSALTSYSNFHGQRRPPAAVAGGANQKPPMAMMNQLTQESLNQYGDNRAAVAAAGQGPGPGSGPGSGPGPALGLGAGLKPQLNASFDDDLPPPPPPLSSSPTLPIRNDHFGGGAGGGEDTDNNSSITTDTTAQMPVPLQRNMPNSRRNEYVNMPVGMPSSSVNPNPMPINNDLHSLSSASPDLSNHHTAPPLPPHNYANMPINKNPLPPPRQEEPAPQRQYNNHQSGYEVRNGNQEPASPRKYNHQSSYEMINSNQNNQRYNNNQQSSDQEPLSYNDTQTLRADQKLEYPPPLKEPQFTNGDLNHHHQNQQQQQQHQVDASSRPHFRQVHLDYDSRTAETKAEPQQATRIPSGHARRDNRASLRQKHRKEMEQAQQRKKSQQQQHQQQNQQQQQQQQQHHTRQNQEDEYGFATGGATALPTSNGFHNPSNQGSDSNADKWYMHDSMKPVGAPVHGGNCKCYRCQRKLTAI